MGNSLMRVVILMNNCLDVLRLLVYMGDRIKILYMTANKSVWGDMSITVDFVPMVTTLWKNLCHFMVRVRTSVV